MYPVPTKTITIEQDTPLLYCTDALYSTVLFVVIIKTLVSSQKYV